MVIPALFAACSVVVLCAPKNGTSPIQQPVARPHAAPNSMIMCLTSRIINTSHLAPHFHKACLRTDTGQVLAPRGVSSSANFIDSCAQAATHCLRILPELLLVSRNAATSQYGRAVHTPINTTNGQSRSRLIMQPSLKISSDHDHNLEPLLN
jgi:hypothetical protein